MISNITFAQEQKTNKNTILGVVLEGGLTNLQEAKAIVGIQFKNIKSENWSETTLVVEVFSNQKKIKAFFDF